MFSITTGVCMYTRSLKRQCREAKDYIYGGWVGEHMAERDGWCFSILLSIVCTCMCTRAHVFAHTCGSHRTTSTVTFRNTAHLPLRQALLLAWK